MENTRIDRFNICQVGAVRVGAGGCPILHQDRGGAIRRSLIVTHAAVCGRPPTIHFTGIRHGASVAAVSLSGISASRRDRFDVNKIGAVGVGARGCTIFDKHGSGTVRRALIIPQTAIGRVTPAIGLAGISDSAGKRTASRDLSQIDEISAIGISAGGDTVLYESHEWGPRAHGKGTVDRVPDEWQFSIERINALLAEA